MKATVLVALISCGPASVDVALDAGSRIDAGSHDAARNSDAALTADAAPSRDAATGVDAPLADDAGEDGTLALRLPDGSSIPVEEAARHEDWTAFQSALLSEPSGAIDEATSALIARLTPGELATLDEFDWSTATLDSMLANPSVVRALWILTAARPAAQAWLPIGRVRADAGSLFLDELRARALARVEGVSWATVLTTVTSCGIVAISEGVAAPLAGRLCIAGLVTIATVITLAPSSAHASELVVSVPSCGASDACHSGIDACTGTACECAAGSCADVPCGGCPGGGICLRREYGASVIEGCFGPPCTMSGCLCPFGSTCDTGPCDGGCGTRSCEPRFYTPGTTDLVYSQCS